MRSLEKRSATAMRRAYVETTARSQQAKQLPPPSELAGNAKLHGRRLSSKKLKRDLFLYSCRVSHAIQTPFWHVSRTR